MFVYLWQFEIDPAHREAFERAYGAEGDWVRLFGDAEGYLGSELLADLERPDRYLTIDRWRSREEFLACRAAHAAAWEELDARCARWTRTERHLADCRALAGRRPTE